MALASLGRETAVRASPLNLDPLDLIKRDGITSVIVELGVPGVIGCKFTARCN